MHIIQLGKERKQLEEKLAETLTSLQDEEDKSKGLGKMKAKHEAAITDLEDRLRSEEKARQELDKEKRKLLAEIAELQEQLLEAKQRVSRAHEGFQILGVFLNIEGMYAPMDDSSYRRNFDRDKKNEIHYHS